MLVGIQGHWKCPVRYVLCNSITSSNLNTLIKNCLQLSFQHNLNVHSVKNGYNDNPDVRQLKSSLKRFLLRNTICGSRQASCMVFEPESCGSVFSLKWDKRSWIINHGYPAFEN